MEGNERDKFRDAVDELMSDLTLTLFTVVGDLKVMLYGYFTPQERQDIDATKTDMGKVTKLFEILKTKSALTHQKCLEALEKLQHKEMASKLREKMEKPKEILSELINLVRSEGSATRKNRVRDFESI